MRPDDAPRSRITGARSPKPRRTARSASSWSAAACRPVAGHRWRPRQVATRPAALLADARAAGVTIALEPLHPMTCADRSVLLHLRPGARPLRRTRRRHRRRARCLPRLVGPRPRAPNRPRRQPHRRLPCLRLGSPRDGTWSLRPRHPRRGRDQHPRSSAPWSPPPATAATTRRSKSSRRENWWKRDPDEVLRICIERHRTVV